MQRCSLHHKIKKMKKNNNIEDLASSLRPLYAHLFKEVASFNDNAFFAIQCGSLFKQGWLMVGRATNGWIEPKDVDELIESLFGAEPLLWVEKNEGNKQGYNTRKSAFWRVIKGVAKAFYPDEWYKHIAWSNLCKVAPQAGNPSNSLYYAQLEACQKILEAEIKALSPKAVLLFTGYSWAKDFLVYLNDGVEPQPMATAAWSKYECKVFLIKGTYYILTEHPQGKKEAIHKETLIDLLKNLPEEE